MSLMVPAGLLDRALDGEVGDQEFLPCVASSLPYAWNLITGLVGELESGEGDFADNRVPPPDEAARGHRAAVFRPGATRSLEKFRSPRAQLQSGVRRQGRSAPGSVDGRTGTRLDRMTFSFIENMTSMALAAPRWEQVLHVPRPHS